jgi:hypothetical protein
LHRFDLKAALLAKHAQHVVLIHFPIALFIAGAAFDFLVQWTKRQSLAAAAFYNFLGRRSRRFRCWSPEFSRGNGNWKGNGSRVSC